MPKYKITGTTSIDFVIEVEADDLEDARNEVDMMDVDCHDGFCATCWEVSHTIEDAEPYGQEAWANMPRSQRIVKLVEAGETEDDALQMSEEDSIPECVEQLLSE